LTVVSALAASLVLALTPANAFVLRNKLICAASGKVNVTVPDPAATDTVLWTVTGGGICTGDVQGPYSLSFSGSGVSTDLGFCDDLLIKDLAIAVTLDLDSLSNPANDKIIDQTWFAPLTTFPLATPFFVANDMGSLAGAGGLFTRYAFNCPPGGSAVANFAWAFLKG
jgi:hypothetical protein